MPAELSIEFASSRGWLSRLVGSSTSISFRERSVPSRVDAIASEIDRSEYMSGFYHEKLSELEDMIGDYGVDVAVNPSSLDQARRILRNYPRGMASPEFSVEPDGCISFDWSSSKYRIISLSLSGEKRLAYAWLDGSQRASGVTMLDGDSLPHEILNRIQQVTRA